MESRRLLSLLLYASPSKPSFFSLSPHLLLADPCSFFPLSRSPFLSFDVSACSVVRSNPSTPYPFEWVRPKVRRLHLPNRPGPYLSSFCRSSCCFGWLVVRGRTKNGYRRGDGAVCWRVGCSAGRSGCAALDEKTRKAERLACIERQARCTDYLGVSLSSSRSITLHSITLHKLSRPSCVCYLLLQRSFVPWLGLIRSVILPWYPIARIHVVSVPPSEIRRPF
jgi:hypothetical protein